MSICYIFGAGDLPLSPPVPGANDVIIAADAGLEYLKKMQLTPTVVIGDFDSLGYVPQGENVHRFPVEKDDTDMMLSVREGLRCGCTEFILSGALGGKRLDHTLANIQVLAFLLSHGATGTLLGKRESLTMIQNGSFTLPDGRGLFSVFAYGGTAEGVTITGAQYQVENVTLTESFPLGVSNHPLSREVCISVKRGRLLIYWGEE